MQKKISINYLLSWVLTPAYNILFVSILIVFHPMLVISRLLTFNLFIHTLTGMCWFLRLNLKYTIGTKFIFNPLPELPDNKPIIIVSNHQGTYDIPLLITYLQHRQLRFISKRELAKWLPSVSYAVRNNKSALIDRGDRIQALNSIKSAARLAAQDRQILCIFPEGTRARHGKMGKFKTGGFSAAAMEMPDAVVLPIAITGSWKLLRYHFFPVPFGVTVTFTALKTRELSGKPPADLLTDIEIEINTAVERGEDIHTNPVWVD